MIRRKALIKIEPYRRKAFSGRLFVQHLSTQLSSVLLRSKIGLLRLSGACASSGVVSFGERLLYRLEM